MKWYRPVALVCAAIGWVLFVVVQLVHADPFPPEISVSQYGVGADGWIFSLWCVVIAAAAVLCYLDRPVPGPARWLIATGVLGLFIMAAVRTDADGLQQSLNARVHQGGAVLALIALPLGMVAALWFASRRARLLGLVVAAASTISGVLILVSAFGVDTAGLGQARSWALWQGLSIFLDLVLVSIYALAVRTIPTGLRAVPAEADAGPTSVDSSRS